MLTRDSCPDEKCLRALLAGAAAKAEVRALEAHLSECLRCRERLEALAASSNVLPGRRADPAPPSPALAAAMGHLRKTILIGEGMAGGATAPLRVLPFQSFGDYELLEEIGRGGMGVVFKARQKSLNRSVALKLVFSGDGDASKAAQRFQNEAEAAASLDHPNIVPVYDFGEHEGQRYFSMKLIRGRSLAQVIAEGRTREPNEGGPFSTPSFLSSPTAVAKLMASMARAVHYAHQRGVLHRDLKPSNILIDDSGAPHLTDFGLAKLLTKDTDLTRTREVMGTPNYMAPERARGESRHITTAADIFSLGAMLYELLTGRRPFDREELMATLRAAMEEEAVPPSTVNPNVSRDLETICLKCLEKEPSRRYASAEILAEELEHFCRGEPISSRPVNATEKLWRWCRRKPALAGSLAALLGALALGMTGIIWQWQRAERTADSEKRQRQRADTNALAEAEQRKFAQQENGRAQRAVTRLEIERAESLLQTGDSSKGLAYLARLLRQQPTNHIVAERLMSALTCRSFCLPVAPLRHGRPLDSLTGGAGLELADTFAFRRAGSIVSLNFSPDGRRMITASKDGTARLWNTVNGEPLGQPWKHDGGVIGAQFSADSQKAVTVSADGTAKIWAVDTSQLAVPPLRHAGAVRFAAFSPDGRKVVTASQDKTVRIWDAQTGEQIGLPLIHPKAAYFACFSPDGTLILSADEGDRARLWDSRTGRPISAEDHFYFDADSAPFPQFSPVLDQVATLRFHYARLRDSPSLREKVRLYHDNYVIGAAYSPDGRRIATISLDTTARIWDARTGEASVVRLRHRDSLHSLDFSSDGQTIATASRDKSARLWDVRLGWAETEPMLHDRAVLSVKLAAGGRRLATVTEGDTAWMWDVRALHPLATLRWMQAAARLVSFGPDGRRLVIVNEADNARICDVQSGRLIGKTMRHASTYPIRDVQFSPDGSRLVTTADDRVAQVWNSRTGDPIGKELRHARTPSRARFSPNGKRVITGATDGIARMWDIESSQQLFELRHADRVEDVNFSPDGSMVVTASRDATVRIWDAVTGRPLSKPLKHDDAVYSAVFDPAGQRVATASKDKTVRIWSVPAGTMLVPPLVHADALRPRDSVEFNRDGSRLLTVAGSAAQIWDSIEGRAVAPPFNHGGSVISGHFSPDGGKVLTASADGTARLWDAETGHAISEPLRHGSRVTAASFSPDGLRVVTCSSDKGVRIWEITLAPLPAPDWLATLADAVAGQHLDGREVSEAVSVENLYRLRQELGTNTEQTYYGRWARWFFAESGTRTISPSSSITVPEYARHRIAEDTIESLGEATRLLPTNALAFARLAEKHLTTNQTVRAVSLDDADWFSRYATNLAPGDPQVLSIRRAVIQQLQGVSRSKPAE